MSSVLRKLGFALALLLGLSVRAAEPAAPAPGSGIPALLLEAMKNSEFDENHWARTETEVVEVKKGKETRQELTIVRFDPSKPYAEQYTPQLVEGHAPTPADLKKYRRMGEDRIKELEKQEKENERQARRDATKGEKDPEDDLRKFLDVDHIAVIAETPTEVSYALPIRKGAKVLGSKLDRFEVVVRVAKADRIVSGLSVRVLDNVRVMLLVNIKALEFTAGFIKPDPAHGPVMNRIQGTADASILFKKLTTKVDATRTDFSWVTPYDERFKVQIGPLKAIGF